MPGFVGLAGLVGSGVVGTGFEGVVGFVAVPLLPAEFHPFVIAFKRSLFAGWDALALSAAIACMAARD